MDLTYIKLSKYHNKTNLSYLHQITKIIAIKYFIAIFLPIHHTDSLILIKYNNKINRTNLIRSLINIIF